MEKEPKYKLGQEVWVAYLSNDFTDKMLVNPTTIIGISINYPPEPMYETRLASLHSTRGYCNIPEYCVFPTREEAVAHLKFARLPELQKQLAYHNKQVSRYEHEVTMQEQEIKEWEHES
jgi:hypothetical protein